MNALPPSIASTMATIGTRLRTLPPHCESDFLRIGDQLGQAIAAIGKVQTCMGGLSSKLTGPDMTTARRGLEHCLTDLVGLVQGQDNGRHALATLHDLITRALLRLDPLSRLIAEIGVLAINARIQASQIHQTGVDFSVFTREISRLQSLAGEAVERSRASLKRLLDTIAAAQASFDAFERDHAASLAEVQATLGQGLLQLHTNDRQMARLLDSLHTRSRGIASGIAAVIGALQINDITMQRSNHVDEALTILADLAQGRRPDCGLAGRETLIIAAACRLQSLQLAQAGLDFDHEVRRVITELDQLADLSRSLAQDTHQALDMESGQDERDSCLGQVERDCGRALDFLEAFATADSEVKRAIAQVSDGVVAMAADIDAIHSIEVDMRIMGLNATLKCGRLGKDGRALAVIAQELRAYSKKTGEDSEAVFKLLSQASAMGADLSRQDNATGTAPLDTIRTGIRGAMDILCDLRQDLTGALAVVDGDGAAALAALTATARGIHLHDTIAPLLQSLAQDLTALADGLDPDHQVTAQIEEDMRAVLNLNYTMESERQIHARFADGRSAQPHAAAAATESIEEFFF